MSSSDLAVSTRGLGKAYNILPWGSMNTTLREVMMTRIRHPFRSQRYTKFWALRDLDLDVKEGEAVGIIGRNGAGKSTLLKIISRITDPTTGEVLVRGKVGSLLEVGTGFSLELTGRENIYLRGSIMGMTRREIDRKFDEIVAFSGVETFLDTPVKRYSSGMYVRLAFAVAAHLDADVLLVDEVLAVGDASFQKKCLGKMGEVGRDGRTVFMVSHNNGAIKQLARTCVLLDGGKMVTFGPTDDVLHVYAGMVAEGAANVYDVEDAPRHIAEENRAVKLLRLELIDAPGGVLPPGADLSAKITVQAQRPVPKFHFGITVFDQAGQPLGTCFSPALQAAKLCVAETFEVRIPAPSLAPGRYHCAVAVSSGTNTAHRSDYDLVGDLLHFEVAPEKGDDGVLLEWSPGWGAILFEPAAAERVG